MRGWAKSCRLEARIRASIGRRRNLYGYERPHTLVSAMRYVVVIMAIAFFLIWDGLYNQGRYLDTTVREMSRIVRYVTGGG